MLAVLLMKLLKQKMLQRVLAALLLSLFYTLIIAYILYGSITYPTDHLIFDLIYSFVYFILLQELFKRLLRFLRQRYSADQSDFRKYVIGYFIFAPLSMLLFTFVGLVPFLLLFDSFVVPENAATEVRLNYIINLLVASGYYGALTAYQALTTYHKTQLQAEQLQKEIALAQLESLKNQVNPHFLFNSLNVLSALITINPDLAEKFTEQLSKVYRYVLEHKAEDLVPLRSELEFMQAYIFLLNIRFKDRLHIAVDLPVEHLAGLVAPLTLQLLVENAIKHNVISKDSPLRIRIFVDDEAYLNVRNNLQRLAHKPLSTGVGLQNIYNRYSYLTGKTIVFGVIDREYVAKVPLL